MDHLLITHLFFPNSCKTQTLLDMESNNSAILMNISSCMIMLFPGPIQQLQVQADSHVLGMICVLLLPGNSS